VADADAGDIGDGVIQGSHGTLGSLL